MDSAQLQGEPLVRKLLAGDIAAQSLGLEIIEAALGRVRARMVVRPDMANGFGICHGGFIFALADSTFGYACNSYGDAMVAAGASIEFVAPTRIGEILTATATETMRTARHGIYDVVVVTGAGHVVALFRGRCARLRVSTKPVDSGGMNY